MSGAEAGTSISLGYMAESYIDFGSIGMFAPILLLGLLYGFIYRFFLQGPLIFLGFSMATAILVFGAYNLETSNIKLVGGNLAALIVVGLFSRLVAPSIWRWLCAAPPDCAGLPIHIGNTRSIPIR